MIARTKAEYIDAWTRHMIGGELAQLALAAGVPLDEYYAMRRQLGDWIIAAANNQKFPEST